MYPLIARARKGMDISIVNPGDIVLILPAMFTGNTDFVLTPFGTMPGGYILASVINSVLVDSWVWVVRDPGFLIILAGILTFIIAQFISSARSLIIAMTAVVGSFVVGHLTFLFFNIVLPIVLPATGVLFGALVGIIVSSAIKGIEEQRITREVEVARLVQSSFFGKNDAESDSQISVLGLVKPANECGGDWWSYFRQDGFVYCLIGDAIGHGVSSALVTAVAYATVSGIRQDLGTTISSPIAPRSILKKLNETLCSMNHSSACMTFQVIRINEQSGECVVINGGNLQPILLKKSNQSLGITGKKCIRTILARGNLLGLERIDEFNETSFILSEGDRIMMYTDGLIENSAASKRALSGSVWLKNVCASHCDDDPDSLLSNIWKSYQDRIGDKPPEDDVTVVLLSKSSE